MKHSSFQAILIACVAAALALPAQARDNPGAQSGMLTVPSGPPSSLPSAADYSTQILPEVEGVVSWKTLAGIEFVPAADGKRMVPKFSSAIMSLDQKEVQVYGFMLPLNLGRTQKRFLVSAVPPDCSFCMPAGPEGVVEVVCDTPIKYGTEPILDKGKLAVLKNDERGVLYQLTDATPLPSPPAKR